MKDYTDTRLEQLIKRRATLVKLLILVYLMSLTTSNLVGRGFVILSTIIHPAFDRRQARRYYESGIDRRRINLAIFTPYVLMTWLSAAATILVAYQLALRGDGLAALVFLAIWLAGWAVFTWRGVKYRIAY